MESKENSLLRPARCGRCGEFFCFLVFGSWPEQRASAGRCSVGFRAGVGVGRCSVGAVLGSVGVGRCSFRAGVGAGLCSFRAGAVLVWASAVFGTVSVRASAVFGPVSVRAGAVSVQFSSLTA